MKLKRNWKKRIMLLGGLCVLFCGCSPEIQEKLSYVSELVRQPLEDYQNQFQLEADSLPTLSELLQGTKDTSLAENEPARSAEQQTSVSLYFLTADGKDLIQEQRRIPKVPGIARQTVEALLSGPQEEKAVALFPEGTALRDICITEDGICRLNLSRQIQQIASAEQEELITLAIIKTLAQFPSIQKVQFMIEGFSVNSLTGNGEMVYNKPNHAL